MSRKQVIVKRLSAIDDLGSMDVLCSDKTGTLTEAHIKLVRQVDLHGQNSDAVMQMAQINAAFETGLKSPLDDAILAAGPTSRHGARSTKCRSTSSGAELLLWIFRADEALFHTGWFVESLSTQILVIFIIRTAHPLRDRPHPALVASSLSAFALAVALPYSPLGHWLGFVPVPAVIMGGCADAPTALAAAIAAAPNNTPKPVLIA